jgi:limonene-1,2-epoxide hydrolase
MATKHESAVLAFIGTFHGDEFPDMNDRIRVFAEDAEYHPIYGTTPPVKGRDAIKEEMERQLSFSSDWSVDVKAIASNDDGKVFVERVDTFSMHGKTGIQLPVNSAWDVGDDGLITSWRDYLNPGKAAEQLGISIDEVTKIADPVVSPST